MEVEDWHISIPSHLSWVLHMLSTDQAVGEASSLLSQGKLSGSFTAKCQVGAEQVVDSGGSLGDEADGSTEIELKQ